MALPLKRHHLNNYLNELLRPEDFEDKGLNGLQIEGADAIEKVAFAVSATADSVQSAADWGADALIVHHGVFWSFHGVRPLTGVFGKRVLPLVRHHINLFGFHLPLDANLEVGHAACLLRELGARRLAPFGQHRTGQYLGAKGEIPATKASDLKEKLSHILAHDIIHSGPDDEQRLSTIGVITGGANSYWNRCLEEDCQAFITGEISEHDWHDAKEAGIHFLAGGHHATERFGLLALQEKIKQDFSGLQTIFFDSPNPA